MELLLASKSPRRRELLSHIGWPIKFVDIDVDETLDTPVAAPCVAETLARRKAEGYTSILASNQVLVTADTVVVHNEMVLGKPHNHEEALFMLQNLSGATHQVYTGVCLKSNSQQIGFTECTNVVFKQLSLSEINYYIDNYKPYDKAGAYGIQEWIGMIGIERIEGCYYNVMGLPVARLYKELQRFVD